MKTGKLSRLLALMGMAVFIMLLVPTGRSWAATSDLFINELRINKSGAEADFFEIQGAPGAPLDGVTFVVLSGEFEPGQIDFAFDLSGSAIPADGFFVAAGAGAASAYGITPDLDLGFDFFGSPTTHLLVSDFTGASGDDLDTDNDGVLDSAPWSAVLDSVALVDGDSNPDFSYSSVVVGPDGSFTPAGTYRCPDAPAGAFDNNQLDFGTAEGTPGDTNAPLCGGGEPADAVINELRIDQPGGDDDEYFELAGTPGADLTGLTYVVIGDGSAGSGVVENVTDLSGQAIGGSGFFVAAESSFTLGAADLTTALNFENSDNVTHLLVAGFNGSSGDDLDTDDDGTLDTMPWSTVVDCVGLVETPGGGDQLYCDTLVGPDGSFVPGHAFLCGDGWQIGAFGGGDDTPGAPNACPAPETFINELRIDQPGGDVDEYFELAGTPGADLTGLTYVVIGDGAAGSGVVENVTDLSGQAIGGSGFFVAAESSFTLGAADLTTALNFENSDNVTHLLVADFTGSSGDDLDTDDDGTLDTMPWSTVVDCVGLVETPGSGDQLYCDTLVGPDGSFVPGHAYLCDDGWQIGAFGGGEDTPGAANACDVVIPTAKIHEVQGSGGSVAINTPVQVEAIVVGDYQGGDQLDGFFIQEEDGDADGDLNTSEGIFVYCEPCTVDVAVGDLVQVTGTPTDFFGMSQIDVTGTNGAVVVVSSGNALPSPATIDLPAGGSTEAEATFESVEGMLVSFTDTLYVSEYFELARYGQLVLTADARPRQFTDANEPGVTEYTAFLDDLNGKRIILDDDNNIQNDAIIDGPDEPYFWPRPGLSISNFIRGGDSIANLTGVMHWSFAGQPGTNAWRVRPVEEAFGYSFTSNNARTGAPDPVGSSLQVASFNVLNYFTTLDARGANSLAELDRQRAKTAEAICGMDADIVGLIEIENNGSAALADLLNGADGINANCGPYDFIDAGIIGTDEIAVAFIYRPATVSPVGDFAILDSSVDSRFIDTKNRPVLAQTFMENGDGATVTVAVNHLKSKGSPCDDVGDPNANDGQGNCNVTRQLAAEAMVDWLAADPTGSGDPDFLIIGDLNAYRNEDPIDALEEGADDIPGTGDDYTDLLDALIGPDAYSYLFDGQLGYLDHALANAPLVGQVTGVTVWHINADEIPVFDYNDGIEDGGEAFFERESTALDIYADDPYRASDHDPVIVGLDLNAPPNCSGAFASIDTLWPVNHQMVAVDVLGVIDPDGDPVTISIDAIFQDEPVNGTGDGDTAPDGDGIGTSTALVRAERDGGGNGRVYHISFTATDSFGNSCSGTIQVSVPRSQGRNGAAVDDGPLFDATLPE